MATEVDILLVPKISDSTQLAGKSLTISDDTDGTPYRFSGDTINNAIQEIDDKVDQVDGYQLIATADVNRLADTSGTNTGDQQASDFDIKDLTDSTDLRGTWSGKQDALGFTSENVANKKQTVTNSETDYPSGKAVYDELAALRHDQLRDPNGDPNYQHITTGAQTIEGVKTFEDSPIIPIPTTDYQGAPKKYVDDADVLINTSINSLKVSDQKQQDSIQSIENTLNAININQEATATKEDYGTLALPKNAANGGMSVKIEGLTAQNLVNGKNIAAGESVTFATILGNKYYVSNQAALITGDGNNYTSTNSGSTTINIIVINLTNSFGSGREPDIATSAKIFPTYFDGVKHFTATGRIRSVGKNIIDLNKPTEKGVFYNQDNGNRTVNSALNTIKLDIKSSTKYTISSSDNTTSIRYTFWTKGGQYISGDILNAGWSATAITSPSTASFIRISYYAVRTNLQFEQNSVASPYEPYTESALYLNSPALRSNGTTKDEIRKGVNGYEHVKRVGVANLTAEKAINGDFYVDTGWSFSGTGWTISDGKARCNSVTSAFVRRNGAVTMGVWQRVLATLENTRNTANYITGNVGTTKVLSNGVNKFYIKHTGTTGDIVFLGSNYEGTLDNVSVKELVPLDGTISNTSTFTELSDGTILYTLETPVITPIAYGGLLNSNSNGTVYREKVIADAGVYSDKLSIQLTDYPISSFETIIKRSNGVETILNNATAVIASGGLSFTHSDLQSGDLVLFTYYFANESTEGKTTLTYYDSRYVIADTANGKFYKTSIRSTNGVASIILTEV